MDKHSLTELGTRCGGTAECGLLAYTWGPVHLQLQEFLYTVAVLPCILQIGLRNHTVAAGQLAFCFDSFVVWDSGMTGPAAVLLGQGVMLLRTCFLHEKTE